MISFLKRLFTRSEPVLSEASRAMPRQLLNCTALRSTAAGAMPRSNACWSTVTCWHTGRAAAGAFAGFILSRMVTDEAEILSVAVAAGWRGRGLSRRLLDLHLRRLAGLGTRAVFLEVEEGNQPALRLYRRAGFRQVGRREGYYQESRGAAALILRRDL